MSERDLINFKEETLDILEEHGKTWDDVKFIQTSEWQVASKFDFLVHMDFEYDNGFGGARIPLDLIIAGTDWWLERGEYDGSEWWEFKQMPKPLERIEDVYLIHNGKYELLQEGCYWVKEVK